MASSRPISGLTQNSKPTRIASATADLTSSGRSSPIRPYAAVPPSDIYRASHHNGVSLNAGFATGLSRVTEGPISSGDNAHYDGIMRSSHVLVACGQAQWVGNQRRVWLQVHVDDDERRPVSIGPQARFGVVSQGGLLNYRISVTQAILALGVFVAFLSLVANGDLVAGLVVVAVAVVAVALLILVRRRPLPARAGRWEESATLPYDCEVVWRLIKPAESAPLLNPLWCRGYHVPGTPDGLGERQALERHDGTTVIVEVIEYEPNRHAVTRQVSPTLLETQRSIQTVEPVEGGCFYTQAVEVDLKRGERMSAQIEQTWRSGVQEQISRIRTLLDSTNATPTVPPPASGSSALSPPPPTIPG